MEHLRQHLVRLRDVTGPMGFDLQLAGVVGVDCEQRLALLDLVPALLGQYHGRPVVLRRHLQEPGLVQL